MADGGVPYRSSTRVLPLVLQTEAAECALACLVMVARFHGHDIDLPSMRRRFGSSVKGESLGRLITMAHQLGFDARPLRAEPDYLTGAILPCILHWDLGHFVVLRRMTRRGAEIFDPARGRYQISAQQLSQHFTGIVLELSPGDAFAPVTERRHVTFRALTGRVVGLPSVLIQLLGLALVIELFALAMPLQAQWIIDQVMPVGDTGMLWALACGFGAALIIQAGLAMARAWTLSWLGATLNAQWVINLFAHVLRLPLDFFAKRHVGDILSRFGSLQSIQTTLTGGFVEALLDGVMGTLALGMLCFYSLRLAAVVLMGTLIYGALRTLTFRTLRRINEEQLVFGARQQSDLIESVRGIQAIKLANRQGERQARIANATYEWAARQHRSQRIALSFNAGSQAIAAAQRVGVVSLGAWLAIHGTFSAGMLVAFLAYADQFGIRVGGLVDKLVEFRLLRLHAERVADIALAEPEPHAYGGYSGPAPEPSLVLQGVSFRYAESEPWVLRNVSLSVAAGESVAITGPSGCGKTTLAKLMLGLLVPTEGGILVGGVDLRHLGMGQFREMVGTVMQDDTLFAGSIADNISFYDTRATIDQVADAARRASVHGEIAAMPMGYETLVGDMGASLSGGQRQRLLLARALYRNPKILVLDEATSHLDVANERAINREIAAMNVTRITIAHREETIAAASRRIDLMAPT